MDEPAIEPAITCPTCGLTSHSPHDVVHGYCGYCNDWTSPPDPVALFEVAEVPQGVRIVYRDGHAIVPDALRYAGFDLATHPEMHVWVARLPRPVEPGMAITEVGRLPAHTLVLCE